MNDNSKRKAVFSVVSVTARHITLYEDTLVQHIVGDHNASDRHFLLDEQNLQQVASILEQPIFVLKDNEYPERYNYLSMAKFNEFDKIVNVRITTEKISPTEGVVVTISPISHFGKGSVSVEEAIVYDKNSPK